MPSMELFSTFDSMHAFSTGNQRFGGISFHIDDHMCGTFMNMKISKKVEKFRMRSVYVDAEGTSSLLAIPTEPVMKTPRWEHNKLGGTTLRPILAWLAELCETMLTMGMVANEFLNRRIAPL
ncbi:hypothetical protein D1007_59428 [Hordeum vulgare]|nr:hypothetical protein D1007_59428 [Hordeum vulgare]